jgi:hypothetical protein
MDRVRDELRVTQPETLLFPMSAQSPSHSATGTRGEIKLPSCGRMVGNPEVIGQCLGRVLIYRGPRDQD